MDHRDLLILTLYVLGSLNRWLEWEPEDIADWSAVVFWPLVPVLTAGLIVGVLLSGLAQKVQDRWRPKP